jgi:Pvc16 N-terminal domain
VATWQLIEHTSRTMARLIEAHLAAELPGNTVAVKLATPHSFASLKSSSASTISIFLYRIAEHTDLRNGRQVRASDGTLRRSPLALELSYLITAWGARGTNATNDVAATLEEHRLMGIVMQALYDHAEVSRAELFEDPTLPPVWGARDNLQVLLEALPLEDLYRIWDSGELPCQLSATYRVRVLGLESSETLGAPRVLDAALPVGRPS